MNHASLNVSYLVLTGAVIGVIIAAFLLIEPSISRVRSLRRDLTQTQQHISERQAFIQSLDRKLATLQAQAAVEQELAVAVPAEESFDDVLRILDRAAAEAGLTIHSVENESTTIQGAHQSRLTRGETTNVPAHAVPLGAIVTISGTYQQTRQFLTTLENTIRIMDITEAQLTRDEATSDQIRSSFTIRFYAYEGKTNE